MSDTENTEAREELESKGIYYLTGEINSENILPIHKDLVRKSLNKWRDSFTFFINSPGGLCSEGWSLIDLIDWIKSQGFTVETIGMGEIYSMGTFLLASGTRGHRMIMPNTTVMVHPAQMILGGNTHEIRDTFRILEIEEAKSLQFWKINSKYKSDNKIKEIFLSRKDFYMTAEEAIRHGIVDRIL